VPYRWRRERPQVAEIVGDRPAHDPAEQAGRQGISPSQRAGFAVVKTLWMILPYRDARLLGHVSSAIMMLQTSCVVEHREASSPG